MKPPEFIRQGIPTLGRNPDENNLTISVLSGPEIQSAVTAVIINEEGIKKAVKNPYQQSYLLNPVTYKTITGISIPFRQTNTILHSLPEEGRTIATALQFPIQIKDKDAYFITQKGGGLSGSAPIVLNSKLRSQQHMPFGFFGDTDAVYDMNLSNKLIESVDCGLPLAILYIDPEQLKLEFNHPYISSYIDTVWNNGDLIVFYFRLAPNRLRIYSSHERFSNRIQDPATLWSLRLAAHTLKKQLQKNKEIKEYVSSYVSIEDCLTAFNNLYHLRTFSVDTYDAFVNAYLSYQAEKLLQYASTTEQAKKDITWYISNATTGKDTCVSLSIYDFEKPSTVEDHMIDLQWSMKNWLMDQTKHYTSLLEDALKLLQKNAAS